MIGTGGGREIRIPGTLRARPAWINRRLQSLGWEVAITRRASRNRSACSGAMRMPEANWRKVADTAAPSARRRCTTGRAKYGGMDISDARRPKALEENGKLKKLLADAIRNASTLSRVPGKRMVRPAAKRQAVAHLRDRFETSERRACSVIAADGTTMRYRSRLSSGLSSGEVARSGK